MAGEEREPFTASGGRLDERVLTTLQELDGRIAFSGLRRVLGAHPESLSRALRRLEREGLVERVEGGYRALQRPSGLAAQVSELRPIARVNLPEGMLPETVLGRLAGHWFGSLRWVGVIERPDGRLLAWAGRDGSGHVLLGIEGRSLRVFVPQDGGGDPSEAEDAAYEVLAHAVSALRPSTSARAPVAFFAARMASFDPWSSDN